MKNSSRIRQLGTFLLSCIVATSVQICWNSAVRANETDFPAIESRFVSGSDWILTLNVKKLEQMFTYPESKLHPLMQVRVMYFTRDQKTQLWSSGKAYEDFWFSNGKPVGCRRHTKLPFQKGSYGVIAVVPGKETSEQTRAIDDTALRLFLELSRAGCMITSVVLPLEICDNAASDLGSFNFYPATQVTAGRVLLLHYSSSPQGFDKYFQYSVR